MFYCSLNALGGLQAPGPPLGGGKGELYNLFYVNGVKIIPNTLIYELLTPVALAHWIMGDGKARPSGLILCTHSFTIPAPRRGPPRGGGCTINECSYGSLPNPVHSTNGSR
jgi:hypothetical protein